MGLALPILAAVSALTPLSGDFDHDGLADRALVRETRTGHEIVVERGAGGTVVVAAVGDALHLYLERLEPGTYRTACAKGLGAREAQCPVSELVIGGDALQFGMQEASQAAAVWTGERFEVTWLSD